MTVAHQTPLRVLKTVFGFGDFRENQQKIIQAVLEGRDVFVLMPAGSGKSICYQIPSMMRDGVGLIVSPLLRLCRTRLKH